MYPAHNRDQNSQFPQQQFPQQQFPQQQEYSQRQGQNYNNVGQQGYHDYNTTSYGNSGGRTTQNSAQRDYYYSPQQQDQDYYYDPNTNQYYYTDDAQYNTNFGGNQRNLGYNSGSTANINRNLNNAPHDQYCYQNEGGEFNYCNDQRQQAPYHPSMDLNYQADSNNGYRPYYTEEMSYAHDQTPRESNAHPVNQSQVKPKKKRPPPGTDVKNVPGSHVSTLERTSGAPKVKPPAYELL